MCCVGVWLVEYGEVEVFGQGLDFLPSFVWSHQGVPVAVMGVEISQDYAVSVVVEDGFQRVLSWFYGLGETPVGADDADFFFIDI